MSLYFVDVEATGIDLENDRIIQISYLNQLGIIEKKIFSK